MSATGRSAVRRADDFYATPAWATRALFRAVDFDRDVPILDPCCGDGAILDVAAEQNYATIGYELDAHRASLAAQKHPRVVCADALSVPWLNVTIATNPPYSLALEFAQRALSESGSRSVAMLLRLNWLAGLRRVEFHRAYPATVLVLPRRPSFVGGGTDATDYAWFLWRRGIGGDWRILDVED